jgi:methylation protein EvaC
MKCKITNEQIKPFMSFGKMPAANGFLKKIDFKNETFYNMEVGFSEKVSLFQLNKFSNPKIIHSTNYPFYTASSEHMKTHFKEYAVWVQKEYLKSNSKLIEVGSNDGTFLKNFAKTNIDYLGFEPSKTIANQASKNNVKTVNAFFNDTNIQNLKKFHNKTDVICAANVIAHIPDLKNLIHTIEKLLSLKGVFIFEEPYLGSMFSKTSYDQIYDEHIFMFSVTSIKKIFQLFDFELIDVHWQKTHGGSMRYVVGRKNKHKVSDSVYKWTIKESKSKLDDMESCLEFKKNCETSRTKVVNSLKKMKNDGKRICGYAATAKSTTVLNYCNLNTDTIDFICDSTNEKIGKFSPGSHIPIVPISHFHKNLPDVAYLFAWNHKDEIFSKEKEFLKKGGSWFSHVSL